MRDIPIPIANADVVWMDHRELISTLAQSDSNAERVSAPFHKTCFYYVRNGINFFGGRRLAVTSYVTMKREMAS